MSALNVELARRGWEAALRGDLETVREFLDPDVTWHGGDSSAPGACRNREQAIEFIHHALGRQPLGELVDVVDAGDRVVVITRVSRKDGRTALVANLMTFRDGRATEMIHFPHPSDALKAAGVRQPT